MVALIVFSPKTHLFWRGVEIDECFEGQMIPKPLYAAFQMMFALMASPPRRRSDCDVGPRADHRGLG